MENLRQFIELESNHHVVFYDSKIVNMDYLKSEKQFQFGCLRIRDNANLGFLKTPKNEFFLVTRIHKTAKKISKIEVEQLGGLSND
jgi:hypothetical protein